MDASLFITLAYSVATLLIGGLILVTWLRARAVRHQLNRRNKP